MISLYDFRDLDLMLKLAAEGDNVTTQEFAEALGLDTERGRTGVGSRLAWMRRYGMLLRGDDLRWSISDGGNRVINARLRATQKQALDKLDDEAMVEVMAHVTSRYQHDGLLAHMLRREFLYGTAKR